MLDRDGVINIESHAYIKTPQEWQAIPGSLRAITLLNAAGFQVVIATNQSGVSRGLFDLSVLELIHSKLRAELAAIGGSVADILFCPHHPDENCACRKPQPGMLLKIKMQYPQDFAQAFYVGDSLTDIYAAYNAGCKPLLVLSGNGAATLAALPEQHQIPHFANLLAATEFIINGRS
jgi:D-glycero-D-manno-heptose 1,7-bisphosphate phosphatase